MASYDLVMDVSSYQPDTLEFFQAAKNAGVKAVIVKLTEGSNPGTAYVSPKAQAQINNAKAVGLKVHAYHFAQYAGTTDAQAEAQWFIQQAKRFSLGFDSYMLADVESQSNRNPAISDTNAFLQAVQDAGYPLVGAYGMASWYWSGRLSTSIMGINWVANYGSSQPGVDDVDIWQFSSKYNIPGYGGVDMSYDFEGILTGNQQAVSTTSQPVVKEAVPAAGEVWTDVLGDKWHNEDGTFTSNQAINLRWGAKTTSVKITTLPAGSVVKYDAWSNHDGYVWIRQPRGNGQYAYMVARDAKTKEAFGTFK